MQFQSSDEINRRQVGAGRRFIIDIVVNEFQERIENEKEWFSIPHNVQQVCRGEDLMSDAGEYGELLNAMDSI
jgi:hypothetical protein